MTPTGFDEPRAQGDWSAPHWQQGAIGPIPPQACCCKQHAPAQRHLGVAAIPNAPQQLKVCQAQGGPAAGVRGRGGGAGSDTGGARPPGVRLQLAAPCPLKAAVSASTAGVRGPGHLWPRTLETWLMQDPVPVTS